MTQKPSTNLVTVFGGSGFLGRHTVRLLAKAGYRVRVAVRRPHTAHFLLPMGEVGAVEVVQANIRNKASVAAALEGAEAAVNLVGILYETGRQKFGAVHGEGAGRIAAAAARAGVKRLIHVSAIGASDQSSAKYARSKAEGEAQALDAFPEATILRPSIVFGPEDEFFNRFAAMARLSPALPLIGGGKTRFQPVFVSDVAAAITACVQEGGREGRTYELGGPTQYTFKELLEFILETIQRKRLLVPLPFGFAKFEAFFLGLLPKPLLTMDQVELLKSDNIVGISGEEGLGSLADFAIRPSSIEVEVPPYLARYRKHGQYETSRLA